MNRSIWLLPLPSHAKRHLIDCGFQYERELRDIEAKIVSQACEGKLSEDECESVLKIVRAPIPDFDRLQTKSAFDLFQSELTNPPIATFATSLDQLLDGGFHVGRITEICGEAGSGKTQICYQLCLNVQLPKALNGYEGEALYIDTEGCFPTKRLLQIGQATIDYCNQTLPTSHTTSSSITAAESMLDHIYHIKCSGPFQLYDHIRSKLNDFLDSHPKVRLVVIDSITMQFRYDYEWSYQKRNKKFAEIAQTLKSLAHTKNVAIVITNHITCDIETDEAIPALGQIWNDYTASRRIMLERHMDTNHRTAKLIKGPITGKDVAEFQITSDGVRDLSTS